MLPKFGQRPRLVVKHHVVLFNPQPPEDHQPDLHPDSLQRVGLPRNPVRENSLLLGKEVPRPLGVPAKEQVIHYMNGPRTLSGMAFPEAMKDGFL